MVDSQWPARCHPHLGRRQELARLPSLPLEATLDVHKAPSRLQTVTQDGDDEGCFRLFHLPSLPEAVVIRDVMGLRKRCTPDLASWKKP